MSEFHHSRLLELTNIKTEHKSSSQRESPSTLPKMLMKLPRAVEFPRLPFLWSNPTSSTLCFMNKLGGVPER